MSVLPRILDLASRVVVAKLRLDGTPTPRSWVARMTKRPAPLGAGKSASRSGGPTFREYCNASESLLRVVWPRPPHALDPGEKSHKDGQPIIKVKVVAVHDDGRVEIEGDD
jgi:hypothetical protein